MPAKARKAIAYFTHFGRQGYDCEGEITIYRKGKTSGSIREFFLNQASSNNYCAASLSGDTITLTGGYSGSSVLGRFAVGTVYFYT